MSITAVQPHQGAAYPDDLKRRTRASLAIAIYELHTYSLGMLATVGERDLTPIGDLVLARHQSALSKRLKFMSVFTALIVREATWEQVAAALFLPMDTARRLYGEAFQRWLDGDPAPWNPLMPGADVAPAIPLDRLEALMGELDGYFLAFAPSDPLAILNGEPYPVSGGLPAGQQ